MVSERDCAPGTGCTSPPPGTTEFNDQNRMKNETAGVIASAEGSGSAVDPVLKQLAETLGAELLQYRPAVALGEGGDVEEAAIRDDHEDLELLVCRDPDGTLITLDVCRYPTRINWFVPKTESSLGRPLEELVDLIDVRELIASSPAKVVESCRAGLLNLQRSDVWDAGVPDRVDLETAPEPEAHGEAHSPRKSCSCAAEAGDGICPAEGNGQLCSENERERLLQPLDPAARGWAEGIVSVLSEIYSEELAQSFWSRENPYWDTWPGSWRVETKIPLHIHVLLEDGSSWILPALRNGNPSNGCYAYRRAAFRAWHSALGCSPAAVLVVDPQQYGGIRLPHFAAQLQTSSVEVWNPVSLTIEGSPALKIDEWQACEAHPETAGMVSTPVQLSTPVVSKA